MALTTSNRLSEAMWNNYRADVTGIGPLVEVDFGHAVKQVSQRHDRRLRGRYEQMNRIECASRGDFVDLRVDVMSEGPRKGLLNIYPTVCGKDGKASTWSDVGRFEHSIHSL